jgi:hypothetical protein
LISLSKGQDPHLVKGWLMVNIQENDSSRAGYVVFLNNNPLDVPGISPGFSELKKDISKPLLY